MAESSKSLRFLTVLGHYAVDRVGKVKQTEIEIFTTDPSVDLSDELVRSNAASNFEKLGFSLADLWDVPQLGITLQRAQAIQRELGAVYYVVDEEIAWNHRSLDFKIPEDDPDYIDLGLNGFLVGQNRAENFLVDSELRLALFLILQGIPGVGWRELKSSAPLLFGGLGSLVAGDKPVGYGLVY
jgi:hypothetical protein